MTDRTGSFRVGWPSNAFCTDKGHHANHSRQAQVGTVAIDRPRPRAHDGHGGRSLAQSRPPELRKVHALLVVDTLSGLGESVKVDGERIDKLLSENLPRDRAEIRVLTGKDVNAEAILAYYRNLKVGRDDALFFYYAGHGATDPEKGHFLALQELNAKPLLRADLRRAMQEHQPGLVVLMTDCCSSRFKLPGKTRRVYTDGGTARTIQPVLRCLLYQSRGVVDITAASGNASFGDDHDGGIFTRTFDKLVRAEMPRSDTDRDGFVSWLEFFPRLQAETEGVFVTWAQHQRARGEEVDQRSQKPHAFDLGGGGGVTLRNGTPGSLKYQYRWAGQSSWLDGSIPPNGVAHHVRAGQPGRQGGAGCLGPIRGGQDRRVASRQDLSVSRFQPGTQTGKGSVSAKVSFASWHRTRKTARPCWPHGSRAPVFYSVRNEGTRFWETVDENHVQNAPVQFTPPLVGRDGKGPVASRRAALSGPARL